MLVGDIRCIYLSYEPNLHVYIFVSLKDFHAREVLVIDVDQHQHLIDVLHKNALFYEEIYQMGVQNMRGRILTYTVCFLLLKFFHHVQRVYLWEFYFFLGCSILLVSFSAQAADELLRSSGLYPQDATAQEKDPLRLTDEQKKEIDAQKKTNESLAMTIDELASLTKIQEVAQQQGLSYNNNNIKTVVEDS